MFKLKQMILMLCLIFSGALCYANTNIEKDGHPVSIELMESTGASSSDKRYQELLHYCICPEEMYMNYAWIMDQTHYEGMYTWHYNEPWYYKTEIKDITTQEGYPEDEYSGSYLVLSIKATRRIRFNTGMYPIPIDSAN